jgi:hypothetical protein
MEAPIGQGNKHDVPEKRDMNIDGRFRLVREFFSSPAGPSAGRSMNHVVGAAVVGLILIGLADTPSPPEEKTGTRPGDHILWQSVVDRVRAGRGYYDAMEGSLKDLGYKLRPFANFRLPALAVFTAMFPDNTIPRALLVSLALLTAGLWTFRAESILGGVLTGLALLFPVLYSAAPPSVVLHDVWTGLLIALSLASKDWRLRLFFGVLALAIREHAIVFAGVSRLEVSAAFVSTEYHCDHSLETGLCFRPLNRYNTFLGLGSHMPGYDGIGQGDVMA